MSYTASSRTEPPRKTMRGNAMKRKVFGLLLLLTPALALGQNQFHIEEASITDIQSAIKSGQITCQGVVEAYLTRAKAYNGVCTALVTKDGAAMSPLKGVVRAGAPIEFPTKTVPVSSVLPNYSQ